MTRRLLTNALLIDPESADPPRVGSLLVEDGRIRARVEPGSPLPEAEVLDLGGRSLGPGFIDLHYHGDFIFRAPERFAASLAASSASMVRHGVTAYLPTTVAWPAPSMTQSLTHLVDAVAETRVDGAAPIGIHLEGPWINPDAAGAQPSDGIRPFDAAEGRAILARGGGLIKMVSLAPEIEGAAALQDLLGSAGVVMALGHSLAAASCTDDAIARGARHVTHLFNAMGPLHHRDPGLAGHVLTDDRVSCDLICDGVHVDPRMVALAFRAKGEKLALITDRIELPDDANPSFRSGGVRDDGRALRLADGRLAGSRLRLDDALRNALEYADLSPVQAVAACTFAPARVLGVERERGTLRPGARADFAILDDALCVTETWLAGEQVSAI